MAALTVELPWLTASWIQEALHRGGETHLRVASASVTRAAPAGDNYSSTACRVRAQLTDGGARSVVVKTLPAGEAMAAAAQEFGGFQRENATLSRVVPQMEALLKAADPAVHRLLTARCLHYGNGPNYFIALEDLSPQGFRSADRHRGLGLRHSLVALRALARFHASSAALLQRDPKIADELTNLLDSNNPAVVSYMDFQIRSLLEVCREMPEMEEVVRSLEAFKPNAVKAFTKVRDPKPGGFNVLSHSDFWTNNMLFRYEDGVPCEVRIIDFQGSHIGPAAIDLLYFLITSLSDDVSLHHQDLLIREYHRALSEAMELLALEPPSLEKILAEIDAVGVHAIFSVVAALPMIKAEKVVDIEGILDGNNRANVNVFRQPNLRKLLQKLLPEYKRKGWLP